VHRAILARAILFAHAARADLDGFKNCPKACSRRCSAARRVDTRKHASRKQNVGVSRPLEQVLKPYSTDFNRVN
jgi:hypothetical protein